MQNLMFNFQFYGKKSGCEITTGKVVKRNKANYEHEEFRIFMRFFELVSGKDAKKENQANFKMLPSEAYQLGKILEKVSDMPLDANGKLRVPFAIHKVTSGVNEITTEVYVERFKYAGDKIGTAICLKRDKKAFTAPLIERDREYLGNILQRLSYDVSFRTYAKLVSDNDVPHNIETETPVMVDDDIPF